LPPQAILVFSGVRKYWLTFWLLAGIVISCPPVRGEMSAEEKRRLFLEAREDIQPVPKATTTPRQKPQPASTPRSKPTPAKKASPDAEESPRPTPTKEPDNAPSPTPAAKPAAKPAPREEPAETPRPKSKGSREEPHASKPKAGTKTSSKKTDAPTKREEPSKPSDSTDFILLPGEDPNRPAKHAPEAAPQPSATPAATPAATAAPATSPVQIPQGTTPEGRQLDAPILVEKSGLEKDQGFEPAPKLQFGGFFKRYRYLTPSVRRAIDSARIQRNRWKYIIIHNSGTRQGNARIFDVYHRRVRKMQNGLAYHFVIGNGNSSGNGEIEIGDRWTRQINGGHVASDYLNNIALGICLVGDLNRDRPTPEQLAAIDELVTYLRSRVGKIKGKPAMVEGHKEINPKPTDCPGDRFDLKWLHQKFR
jgi:hypothetical protein